MMMALRTDYPALDPSTPAPMLSPRTHRLQAREIRTEAFIERFMDPCLIGHFLLIECYCYVGSGNRPRDPDLAAYEWDRDPLKRSWLALLEVVRVKLLRAGLTFTAGDIELIALDIVAPPEIQGLTLEELKREQIWCPEAILERIMAARELASHS